MKQETHFIQGLNTEITFHIGTSQDEHFKLIDLFMEFGNINNDLWFHAKDVPSCHVFASIPDKLHKNDLKYIIKVGALLCKNNTNKIKNTNNVLIMYTEIKNVKKTKIQGSVHVENSKNIII